MELRSIPAQLRARRSEAGNPQIVAYFAMYDTETELWPGEYESIAPGAFGDVSARDIRALINHDTTLVLGRTTVGTLRLESDATGLLGEIDINALDTDATNLYARVERGDVSQCSFGFDITNCEEEYRADGSRHCRLTGIDLYEVSVVTFPAYEDTIAAARDAAERHDRHMDAWRRKMIRRLKNESKNYAAAQKTGRKTG